MSGGRAYQEYLHEKYVDFRSPWEPTRWYHPARWFGFDLRRYNEHPMAGGWEYGRSKKVAREMLHSVYGDEPRRGDSAMTFD